MANRLNPSGPSKHFLLSAGFLLGTWSRSASSNGLSLRTKTLGVSYVDDRQKTDLWTTLKANFTLPREEDPEKPVIEPMIKAHAPKKMAELFRRWKNELKSSFVDQDRTPEFIGQFEKIKD